MAQKPIEVSIGADAGPFDKAVRAGIIEPLEDVDKALDELGKSRGLGEMEDDLKDAQKETKDLKDETKETARTIEREFKGSFDTVKKSSGDAFDGIKAGAQDAKTEAASSARESAASFSGSFDDISDLGQEVAANAFAGFGPAGAAAGLVAAAGIGIVTAEFDRIEEARKASEERITDWADAYIESGGRVLDASVIIAKSQDIITDPDKWKEARRNATDWGVSIEDAILAMSGHEPSIATVKDSIDLLADAAERAQGDTAFGGLTKGSMNLSGQLDDAQRSFATLTGEMDAGATRGSILQAAYMNLIDTTAGVTEEVDELGNKLYSLPDGTQVMVSAETGEATTNVDNFKGDVDGIATEKTTTLTARASTGAASSDMVNWRFAQESRPVYVSVRGRAGGGDF